MRLDEVADNLSLVAVATDGLQELLLLLQTQVSEEQAFSLLVELCVFKKHCLLHCLACPDM